MYQNKILKKKTMYGQKKMFKDNILNTKFLRTSILHHMKREANQIFKVR